LFAIVANTAAFIGVARNQKNVCCGGLPTSS